jgi:perosamine synthetase
MTDLAEDIVQAIARAIGPAESPVPLHEPEFVEADHAALRDCLASGWVSSLGPFVERFEHMLADFTAARHAVAVVNGTAALHVSLLLAGVRPGDEVLMPSLTFVASANAVSYCGAVAHFVDSDPERLAVDPAALAAYLETICETTPDGAVNRVTGRPIRALLAVHVLGVPADMEALVALAARYRIALVEDAAESLGSHVAGRHTGTFGVAGTLSFNGNKVITTGGGGAILTDDPEIAARARHLTTTARRAGGFGFVHDEVGYNYRLPGLNAALGCGQLEALGDHLARKRKLAERYRAAFASLAGAAMVAEPAGGSCNNWLNGLMLDAADPALRDRVIEATNAAGYLTRPAWTPMHMLPMYRDCPRMALPGAERIFAGLVCLPSSSRLAAA